MFNILLLILLLRKPYTPHRRHDLESIVRSLIYLHYELSMPNFSKNDISKLAKCVLEYWKVVDECLKDAAGDLWLNALEIARSDKPNSDVVLLNHFFIHFRKISLDNEEIAQKYEQSLKESNIEH